MKEEIPWPESETGYIRIPRKEIRNYITEELLSLTAMWHRISRYGWPHGGGYLAEPSAVRIVVELFDAEKSTYMQWERGHESGTHGTA